MNHQRGLILALALPGNGFFRHMISMLADYVHIMVESGMSLPMGADQSVPLVMEVLSLFSPYSLLIQSCISLLVLLCTVIHSFITTFLFTQALQKIRLANHIHSLVELHACADAIQQLEVALLGSPTTKLLDVLSDEHATTGSTSMIYYCTSLSIWLPCPYHLHLPLFLSCEHDGYSGTG